MQWLRMASILLLWAGVCRMAGAADVAHSLVLANMDRNGWPQALTTQADVDTASRAEVLMVGKALLASEALDEQGLKQRLGVQAVKLKSVRQVREGLWDRLLLTYRNASQNCDGEPFLPPVCEVSRICVSWRRRSLAKSARLMQFGRARARCFMSRRWMNNCGWRCWCPEFADSFCGDCAGLFALPQLTEFLLGDSV